MRRGRRAWRAEKPCRSALRGAFTRSRKRCRPRITAIGASAGPSSVISSSPGRPPAAASFHFAVWRQRKGGSDERARMIFRRGAVLPRDDQSGEPAERRQAGSAALLRLLAIEFLGIARKNRADHRMIRLPGLHQGAARPSRSGRRGPSPAAAIERCARRRADRRSRATHRHR